MTDKDVLDTYLDDPLSAFRAYRKTMNVKICAVETSSIECGIVDTVLFSVDYKLILDFSVAESTLAVVDSTREPVVPLC